MEEKEFKNRNRKSTNPVLRNMKIYVSQHFYLRYLERLREISPESSEKHLEENRLKIATEVWERFDKCKKTKIFTSSHFKFLCKKYKINDPKDLLVLLHNDMVIIGICTDDKKANDNSRCIVMSTCYRLSECVKYAETNASKNYLTGKKFKTKKENLKSVSEKKSASSLVPEDEPRGPRPSVADWVAGHILW
jgi:hypothetical protein